MLVIHLAVPLPHVLLLRSRSCILLLPSCLGMVVCRLRALSHVVAAEVMALRSVSLVHWRMALHLTTELLLGVRRIEVVLVDLVMLHLHLVQNVDVVRGLI